MPYPKDQGTGRCSCVSIVPAHYRSGPSPVEENLSGIFFERPLTIVNLQRTWSRTAQKPEYAISFFTEGRVTSSKTSRVSWVQV